MALSSRHRLETKTHLSIISCHFIIYLMLTQYVTLISGQCNDNQVTFEKITGMMTTIGGGNITRLGRENNIDGRNTGMTSECFIRCRSNPLCTTFEVNYGTGDCRQIFGKGQFTSRSFDGSPDSKNIFVSQDKKISVFNKICLTAKICSRAWSFERVPNHLLFGYDDRIYLDIANVHDCQDLCLKESSFQCISGEYDYIGRRCYLSKESRRSQPSSFRPASTAIDYFENQCQRDDSGCQYEEKNGVDLGYVDVVVKASTEIECRDYCDQFKPFVCRSFTYQKVGADDASVGRCLLSSDDTISAGVRSLTPLPGAKFFQKTNCLNLKLLCTTEAMIVTLHSREPFTGRIYSKSVPGGKCEVSGAGHEVTELSMPLVASSIDSLCGIVAERDGRYSNTVVVQHHPLIQRRGDREVKLLCLFESASKTVSNSYSIVPTGLGSSATATVNATAPSPSIRLRITDKRGRDIKGTKLGAEIYLQIEIDETSAFGIFARDLKAHSGSKEDSLTLLDERGCPVDPSIFPGLLKVENSKKLQGKFEAFKFSEDVVVRFTLNVQFCISDCQPADCGNGVLSYGKRKKRQVNFNKILPDYPLTGEIIVEGSSVTQLRDEQVEESEDRKKNIDGMVCMGQAIFMVSIATIFVIIICILCSCAVCLMLNRRKLKKLEAINKALARDDIRSEYSLRYGSVFTNDRLSTIHDRDEEPLQ